MYDPDLSTVQSILAGLDRTNWYAILERPDGWYVQVGRWKDEPLWGLEYREGTPDRHFRAEVATLEGVDDVFHRFAAGDYSWQGNPEWHQLAFG